MHTGLDPQAAASVLGDELACEDLFPHAFVVDDPSAVDPFQRRRMGHHAVSVLRTLTTLDVIDEPDEAVAAHVARMECKIDLLLSMLSSLVTDPLQATPARRMSWSSRGALIDHPQEVQAGRTGVLHVRPAALLPSSISLPCKVVATRACGDGYWHLALAFVDLDDKLVYELQGLQFRHHRRHVASMKRQAPRG